jgi:hypothetical protein
VRSHTVLRRNCSSEAALVATHVRIYLSNKRVGTEPALSEVEGARPGLSIKC